MFKFKRNDIIICKNKELRYNFIEKVTKVNSTGYWLKNICPYNGYSGIWQIKFIESNYKLAPKLMRLLYA